MLFLCIRLLFLNFFMQFQFQETSGKAKLIIIGLFVLVAYLLYTLTTSIYKSYQIDLHIKAFIAENKRIEDENRKQIEDFEYYSSDSYIEKIAKENLGKVKSGEKVIIIPKDVFEDDSNSFVLDDDESAFSGLSNSQKWWLFFFDS